MNILQLSNKTLIILQFSLSLASCIMLFYYGTTYNCELDVCQQTQHLDFENKTRKSMFSILPCVGGFYWLYL